VKEQQECGKGVEGTASPHLHLKHPLYIA